MPTLSNNFEFSTNGTTITNANSGTGGNAFDYVASGPGPAISTAQRHGGTRSTRFTLDNYVWCGWASTSLAGMGPVMYGRAYFRWAPQPTADNYTSVSLNLFSGTGMRFQAEIHITVSEGASFSLWQHDGSNWNAIGNATIVSIPDSFWYRIELMANRTTGEAEARMAFTTPDSLTSDFIITGTAANFVTSTVWNNAWVDGDNYMTTESMWADDFAVTDVGWLGPTAPGDERKRGWGALM